jgi:hypothetical protein
MTSPSRMGDRRHRFHGTMVGPPLWACDGTRHGVGNDRVSSRSTAGGPPDSMSDPGNVRVVRRAVPPHDRDAAAPHRIHTRSVPTSQPHAWPTGVCLDRTVTARSAPDAWVTGYPFGRRRTARTVYFLLSPGSIPSQVPLVFSILTLVNATLWPLSRTGMRQRSPQQPSGRTTTGHVGEHPAPCRTGSVRTWRRRPVAASGYG